MNLLSPEQIAALITNGQAVRAAEAAGDEAGMDPKPLVKLLLPGTDCIWLLSEISPDDPGIAYGLCDLGFGEPELGDVDLKELAETQFARGLKVEVAGQHVTVARGTIRVECDRHWTATNTLSCYASEARQHRRIIA